MTLVHLQAGPFMDTTVCGLRVHDRDVEREGWNARHGVTCHTCAHSVRYQQNGGVPPKPCTALVRDYTDQVDCGVLTEHPTERCDRHRAIEKVQLKARLKEIETETRTIHKRLRALRTPRKPT